MADSNPDIKLLAGLLGGGELSGKSGQQIKRELDNIIKEINKNPLEVEVKLSSDATADFKKQVTDLTKLVQTEAAKIKKAYAGIKLPSDETPAEKRGRAVLNETKNATAYYKAISKLASARTNLNEKISRWSASKEGTGSGAYKTLTDQRAAYDSIEKSLMSGTMKAADFEAQMARVDATSKSAVETIKKLQKDESFATQLQQIAKVNTALEQGEKYLREWTAAESGQSTGSYRDIERAVVDLKKLRDQLENGEIATDKFNDEYLRLISTIRSGAAEIKTAGENTLSFGDKLVDLAKKLGMWFSAADVAQQVIRTVREMVTMVTEIDTAMTELRKVTDETEATYGQFLEKAAVRAKQLGATVSDVVSSSADFARLGHSIGDASALADAAIIYQNVGDGISSIDEASSSIISTMQAFGIEAKNAMSIIDSFNAVGNRYAVSSKGIGEALLNSAAALSAAGNNLHESIALIAAAINYWQGVQ